MRKDLLVLGVGGTLPNLFSLSSLCAPVVDDEMRRRASFSRHQHQDLQHQDEHEVIMDHKNLMNNNHGHTVENDEPLEQSDDKILINNNADTSDYKTEAGDVLSLTSDTLDNSFIVLNMSPGTKDDETDMEGIQGKIGKIERSFSKKLKRTKSSKAQINKADGTQTKSLKVNEQKGEFEKILNNVD